MDFIPKLKDSLHIIPHRMRTVSKKYISRSKNEENPFSTLLVTINGKSDSEDKFPFDRLPAHSVTARGLDKLPLSYIINIIAHIRV